MKKEWLLVIVAGLAFIIFSAFQKESPKDRIEEEVNKKVEKYRDLEMKRCRKKMFERAGLMADSLLMARSRSKAIDTLVKPPIPIRPNRPEVLYPKDSTPLAPFLELDTMAKIRQDTSAN